MIGTATRRHAAQETVSWWPALGTNDAEQPLADRSSSSSSPTDPAAGGERAIRCQRTIRTTAGMLTRRRTGGGGAAAAEPRADRAATYLGSPAKPTGQRSRRKMVRQQCGQAAVRSGSNQPSDVWLPAVTTGFGGRPFGASDSARPVKRWLSEPILPIA